MEAQMRTGCAMLQLKFSLKFLIILIIHHFVSKFMWGVGTLFCLVMLSLSFVQGWPLWMMIGLLESMFVIIIVFFVVGTVVPVIRISAYERIPFLPDSVR